MADELTQALPNVNFGNISNVIIWFIGILFLIAVLSLIAWLVIRMLKYKFKIVIFGKVSGKWEIIKVDRAMLIPYGKGGDKVMYLRKTKRTIPLPSLQSGKNTYYMCLREDDELINFEMEDLDKLQKQMGAKFLDKEMRYARVSLQGHFKERYDRPKFWDKYGALVINVVAIVLIMVMLFLIIDKVLDGASTLNRMLETQEKIQDLNLKVLNAIEQVTAGSGIRPG